VEDGEESGVPSMVADSQLSVPSKASVQEGLGGGEQVLSKPGLVHPLLLLSSLLPSKRLLQWLLSLFLQGLPPSILAQLDGLCSESSLGAEYPMPRLVSKGTRLLRTLHRRNACRRLSIEMSGAC